MFVIRFAGVLLVSLTSFLVLNKLINYLLRNNNDIYQTYKTINQQQKPVILPKKTKDEKNYVEIEEQ
jgi:hypothetical protein